MRNGSRVICLFAAVVFALAASSPAFAQGASVTGRVFRDVNGSKLAEARERPVPDVKITLTSVTGGAEQALETVETGRDGTYAFEGLDAGAYYLDIQLPARNYFIEPVEGGSAALPAQGSRGRTPVFSLKDGEAAEKLVGTTIRPAYFNFVAFEDKNLNGSRYSTEPMLQGVEVTITYRWLDETYVIAKDLTNKNGFAQFRFLTPATYRMQAALPRPYRIGPRGAKDNVFFNVFVPSGEHAGTAGPYALETMLGLGISGIQ